MTTPVEPDARRRAQQSRDHHDCRSATIRPSLDKIALALSSPRDNHHLAATAKMAILIVAAFPSRLSRYTGDREICRMVRTPSVDEEDDKRPHRERDYLVQERVRIENRIAALLATQGVLKRPSLRTWAADLDALRTGDGRPLPPCLKAELDRLRRRLLMTLDMIREVEAAREQAMEAHDSPANQTVKALCKLRGLGDNFSAVLAKEVFYRTFDNRRQIAAYLGLAPTPFQSGAMDRDRRINRAGNSRAVRLREAPPCELLRAA